ncbi:MAG: ribonuclease H-like domain-containing protein [Planctomycetes bacterium]|nr:ribonuclease H-like domain-containing protein [Planctomycetota bacterium]
MSESLRERLARLRREDERASPPPASSVRERLARRAARVPVAIPPERLVQEGTVLARRTAAERHGGLVLCDALSADRALLAREARDERIADLDPAHALYLDTETTGLSGGSGTYVWLVGLGAFEAGRFEVWQGFLPEPAQEQALLAHVAERIRAAAYVVSFFGKSFDRHRLEDKMRMHGIEPPFAEKPHLDLYWPLRRRYRGHFGDCRLRTLESQLCGVEREDDLPGSFAPAAWFDFLHGRPHRLEGVFQHNLDDVKSLVTLLAHLGRELPSPSAPRASSEETLP